LRDGLAAQRRGLCKDTSATQSLPWPPIWASIFRCWPAMVKIAA